LYLGRALYIKKVPTINLKFFVNLLHEENKFITILSIQSLSLGLNSVKLYTVDGAITLHNLHTILILDNSGT
jgi:hypothetical protein